MRLLAAVCTVVLLGAVPLAADFEQQLQAALGPYYGALVASSRGNIDQTQRYILLFASRWDTVRRTWPTQAPPGLRADPEWAKFVRRVEAVVQEARESCRARNLPAAHAQLEYVRMTLRQIDARHRRMNVDDALTDFHDSMLRMIGHVAGVNEIMLRPKDFDDIAEDYQTARQSWAAVDSLAGPLRQAESWRLAAASISQAMTAIDRELQGRRPQPLAAAIEGLKEKYNNLLLAVSRARG